MTILTIVKLTCILLCFLYVLFRTDRDYLLKVAFLFTFASDLILANNPTLPLGTMVFCFAQLAHFIRLNRNRKFLKLYSIGTLTTLIFGFILGISAPENSLFIFAAVYAITEIINFILALSFSKLTALGFFLFILCDLCIAIGFILPEFKATSDWLCWIFYLPSQILLATSRKTMIK